jgi:phage terminase Nu1 subunit (DNA packaging protein)
MPTNDELAAALGVSARTIPRMRKRGMPAPADGEDLQEWAKRASVWRTENRKPPGRPVDKTPEEQDAETRFRLARAIKIELEVEQIKGRLHSKDECEAAHARRCHEVTISLLGLGQAVARRCYQRTPDVIQEIIDEEVRRRLLVLSEGGIVVDDDSAA